MSNSSRSGASLPSPDEAPSGPAERATGYVQRLQRRHWSTRYVPEHEIPRWYLDGYSPTGAIIPGPFNSELHEIRHEGADGDDTCD